MSTEPVFSFDLPADAPRTMQAISVLAATVDRARAGAEEGAHRHDALEKTVAKLAADHKALRQHVQKAAKSRGDAPTSVRWDALDREAARTVWAWLIDRVQWLVERY